MFSRSDFEWHPEDDEYRCPDGKALRHGLRKFSGPRTGITRANTLIYRASERDCKHCALKAQCCPNTSVRKITQHVNESARDMATQIARTPAYVQSRRQRKKVEVLFAHLKGILRLRQLRSRGPSGAHNESLLAATTQIYEEWRCGWHRRGPKWGMQWQPDGWSACTRTPECLIGVRRSINRRERVFRTEFFNRIGRLRP